MFVFRVAEAAVEPPFEGLTPARQNIGRLTVDNHSHGEQCSLPLRSVTAVAAAREREVDERRIALPFDPTVANSSMNLASATTESIVAADKSFCLDAN